MLNILGGGPAGLAAGFYARRSGMRFKIYEAGAEVGGNCRTLRWGDFLFDTGAHRFHDKDPEVTAEIRALLGDDLQRVHAPSQICWDGRFINFPLSPLDLLRKLDWRTLTRISMETLRLRTQPAHSPHSFRDLAVGAYGQTLAEMFLLNYSRKLWGEETERLSPDVAGQRLKNLDLKSFLIEAAGRRRSNDHLDGAFYYPKHGIGMIFERVAEAIGTENIACGARITGLVHERGCVRTVILNGNTEVEAGTVLSTLPLTLTLGMLRPRPPAEILETAMSMRFRHLVLGVFLLDRPKFTANASVYFPGDQPFTRVYESKNRSAHMAPAGQTAIVVEIPCERTDRYWTMEDHLIEQEVREALAAVGLLRDEEVLAFRSYRVPFAYPVLEAGFERKAERVAGYLASFENLHLLGRSAQFQYTHIHDMFRMGRETIRDLAASEAPPEFVPRRKIA